MCSCHLKVKVYVQLSFILCKHYTQLIKSCNLRSQKHLFKVVQRRINPKFTHRKIKKHMQAFKVHVSKLFQWQVGELHQQPQQLI